MSETCSACGEDYEISEWPWCPHGRPSGGFIADSIPGAPGGSWIENLGPEPVWVRDRTELRREAAKRGLKWDPAPQKKGVKVVDNDCHGRYNGGALPEYKVLHRPAPEESNRPRN